MEGEAPLSLPDQVGNYLQCLASFAHPYPQNRIPTTFVAQEKLCSETSVIFPQRPRNSPVGEYHIPPWTRDKGKTEISVGWVTGGPRPPQSGGNEGTNWEVLPDSALPLFLITYLPPPLVVPS